MYSNTLLENEMLLEVCYLTKPPYFQNVSFAMPNSNNVNATTIICIMGQSGSGKSTFLRCLAHLTNDYSGNVFFKSKTPLDMGIPNWRSHLLYVPQKVPAYDCTPYELFLQFSKFKSNAKKSSPKDPTKIARQFAIDPSLWYKSFSKLSGGEGQRIMLAIGLAFSPDILLLDEPTSGLDHATTLVVEACLKNYNCIWITHSSEQAKRVANQIHVLEKGLLKQVFP